MAHNHPGGLPSPSNDDLTFTVEMERACNAIDLKMIEHIIYADGECHPIMMQTKLRATHAIEYDIATMLDEY